MPLTMIFYAQRNTDGLIHVTNALGIHVGQHHVHDEASWEDWKAGNPAKGISPVNPDAIEWLTGVKDCDCGQPIWRRAKKWK